MRVKTGDTVLVTKGKDRGRTGTVARAFPGVMKVIIEGINLRKKHQRPRRAGEKGKVIAIAHSLPVANVTLICPTCKQPTRVGYRTDNDQKQRVCKKCKALL